MRHAARCQRTDCGGRARRKTRGCGGVRRAGCVRRAGRGRYAACMRAGAGRVPLGFAAACRSVRLPCDAWGCVRFEAAACEDAFRLQWGEGGGRDGAAEAVNDAGLGFRTSGDPAASGSERGRSARPIGGLLEGRSDPRSGWRGGEGAVPGRRLELQRGRSASFVFGFARNRLRDASQGCLRVRFATRLREPNEAPALRGRFRERGAAPRRERMFHMKHFSASKAEGGGIARAKLARGGARQGFLCANECFT